MRPLLLATASGAITALLSCVPAVAEPAPGWVDPPARSAERSGGAPASIRDSTEGAGDSTKSAEPAHAKTAGTTATDSARPATASDRISGGRLAERRERVLERRQERRAAWQQAHARQAASGIRPPLRFAPGEARIPTAQDPRLADWAGAAQHLAADYLASISSPNAETLAETPRFYAAQVRFHGRSMTTAALIAEKRSFFRRWPERRYAAQDGTMRTACDAASGTCVVRAVLGFQARDPRRGARSQGLSEFVLTVSFARGRPVIVAESSRVLHRGAAA